MDLNDDDVDSLRNLYNSIEKKKQKKKDSRSYHCRIRMHMGITSTIWCRIYDENVRIEY